jgi:mannosyltransferase
LLDRPPSGRALATWAIASALALATHYFAAFLVLPQAIWLATRKGSDPLSGRDSRGLTPWRRRALPAVAAVVVATLALAPLALHQRSLGLASFIAGESLPGRVARAAKNMLVGFDSPLETVVAAAAGLIVLAGAGAAFAWTRGRERSGAGVALAVGVVAVAVPLALAALGVDYLDTRNLLGAWLPLMTIPAAGLAAGRIGRAGLALLCALGIASIVGVATNPAWQRDDWRGMAAALGAPDSPRAVVIQPASGREPLALYMRGLRPVPAAGARVRELAVVSPVRRDVGGEHPAPPPRRLPPIPAGFELAAHRLTDGYSVVVLRAREPQVVTAAQGQGLARATGPVAVALQMPSRKRSARPSARGSLTARGRTGAAR